MVTALLERDQVSLLVEMLFRQPGSFLWLLEIDDSIPMGAVGSSLCRLLICLVAPSFFFFTLL